MIHPNTVERTIIIIEKTNEFTDISVARCLDGIMSLSRISVRTSRKSSEKDPINPPKTIWAGSPVKLIRKAKSTPIVPNSRIARMTVYFHKYRYRAILLFGTIGVLFEIGRAHV